MKPLFTLLAVATLLMTAAPTARGQDAVSVEFFYEHLSPHGDWYDAGDYGYVWQPYDIQDDWRPYADGRWVYTDAGWTWDSVEPYGWAVYHYGRWAEMQDLGWVWVPGTEWGPAWVSWRRSPEYVGWAPLPPEARFTSTIGISSWADDYYDIGPGHYRFVETQHFGAPRLNSVFVDRRQNVTIINQTTNITNITYRDNVIYNGGPEYDDLARRSREPISRYRLDRRRDFDGNRGRDDAGYFQSRVEGDSYSVVAPRLREDRVARPSKVARSVDEVQVNRGWREVEDQEEVTRLRAKMKGDEPAPADMPKRAEIVTRSPRSAGEAKGGDGDPRGPGREKGKGDGKGNQGDGKGNKGGNQPGMRNLPPEPGAPGKGNNRPDPGNQTKEKGKDKDGNPAAPRPNRMPVDPVAPRDGNPGGKGGNEGKGKADREDRPANPPAPRPNRMPVEPTAPGNGNPGGKGGNEGKGKADREDRPVNPAAPRPNRMPVDPVAPRDGNPGGKGDNEGRGKADREDRPVNPAAPRPNRMPVEPSAPGNGNPGGKGGNEGKGKADREDRPANPGANQKGRPEGGRPEGGRPADARPDQREANRDKDKEKEKGRPGN